MTVISMSPSRGPTIDSELLDKDNKIEKIPSVDKREDVKKTNIVAPVIGMTVLMIFVLCAIKMLHKMLSKPECQRQTTHDKLQKRMQQV